MATLNKRKVSKSPQPPPADDDVEDGEVKVYDQDSFLVTDGETFNFQIDNKAKINWRQVTEFHSLMFDNPYAVQMEDSGRIAEQHILQNLESIAFKDHSDDRNGQWLSLEG